MDKYDKFQLKVIVAALLFTFALAIGLHMGTKYTEKVNLETSTKELNKLLDTNYNIEEVSNDVLMVDLINSQESIKIKKEIAKILSINKTSVFVNNFRVNQFIENGRKLVILQSEEDSKEKTNKKFKYISKKTMINIIILSLIVSILAILEGIEVAFLIQFVIICSYIVFKLFIKGG